jgi:hypothetical protein
MTKNGEKINQNMDMVAAQPRQMAVSKSVWDSNESFELGQRQAKLLASSSFVPKAYQGKVDNCFIALDIAKTSGINPLMVMQNLYVVNGNPSWSGSFCMVLLQSCGRFSKINYEMQGSVQKGDLKCRVTAVRNEDGECLTGTWVTWEMVKGEGWLGKSGSKWQTMPEQMMKYRSASFFARAYAPEALLGLRTSDELEDIKQEEPRNVTSAKEDEKAVEAKVKAMDKELATATEQASADDLDIF